MTELMAQTVDDVGGGSRRTFLVGAAGLAAGAGGLAAVQAAGATPFGAGVSGVEAAGSLVAYVRDLAAGEIAVMRGDTEVVVVNHELARTLAGLAGGR